MQTNEVRNNIRKDPRSEFLGSPEVAVDPLEAMFNTLPEDELREANYTYARMRKLVGSDSFLSEYPVNHADGALRKAWTMLVNASLPVEMVAEMVADHKRRYAEYHQAVADHHCYIADRTYASSEEIQRYIHGLAPTERQKLKEMFAKTQAMDVLMQLAIWIQNGTRPEGMPLLGVKRAPRALDIGTLARNANSDVQISNRAA